MVSHCKPGFHALPLQSVLHTAPRILSHTMPGFCQKLMASLLIRPNPTVLSVVSVRPGMIPPQHTCNLTSCHFLVHGTHATGATACCLGIASLFHLRVLTTAILTAEDTLPGLFIWSLPFFTLVLLECHFFKEDFLENPYKRAPSKKKKKESPFSLHDSLILLLSSAATLITG